MPRILISGLSGGSGKTLLSLGLCRAFSNLGLNVKPFKKGPDYIDARWLQLAAKNPCTNLDPFFLDAEKLQALFTHSNSQGNFTINILEGNRGLFDGQDLQGTCSSSELARILNTPIIISLNVTKMTRTAAAVLAGIANFEKSLTIGGVILSQVGTTRHENIVKKSIEHYTDIPVLGALPRLRNNPLPERHMGLYDAQSEHTESTLESLATFVKVNCNLDQILHVARRTTPLEKAIEFWPTVKKPQKKIRIGYVLDQILWFYYAENLEALHRAGAELVPLSLLDNTPWPQDLHGIYLGGGYPEEFLQKLSTSPHLKTLRAYSEQNMPIYAECGGFMLLASSIDRDEITHTMSGIFPTKIKFHARPQGLGYVQAKVKAKNPFHPQGINLRGHEFHYSCCLDDENNTSTKSVTHNISEMLCFDLQKGVGMGKAQDGLCVRNTFASYTHIYAPACPWWAENFVNLAANWAQQSL